MARRSSSRSIRALAAFVLSLLGCASSDLPHTSGVDAGTVDLAAAVGADLSTPGAAPDLASGPMGTLPLAVDDKYVTSGFMGDGSDVVMTPARPGDSTDCNGQRASAGAAGSCHQIVYTPTGTNKWAGVFWQSPANNWGDKPGFPIPSGATRVSFQARGAAGGEKVTFQVGGIADSTKPNQDSVKVSAIVTLTAAWAPYTVVLSGQSYGKVLGGFCWSMAAADAGAAATFFVDDIQWK
ncbi:MAG: Glutamate synthase large chain [Myxococcales bacterium]|nr:Glutamate synthase large chain [Myxococcales bacterium]